MLPPLRKTKKRREILETVCLSEVSCTWGWKQRLANKVVKEIQGACSSNVILSLIPNEYHLTYKTFAYYLAGNWHLLNKGEPLTLPGTLAEYEMCVEVVSVLPGMFNIKTASGMYQLTFDVLAGPSAGTPFTTYFPDFLVRLTAAQALKRKNNKPCAYDLAGMCFTGIFGLDSRQSMSILEVTVKPSEVESNKRLLRNRASGCVYASGELCDFCNRGRSSCSLAYHVRDLSEGICIHPKCGERGYVTKDRLCTTCVQKGRFIPKPENREKNDNNLEK